MPVDNNAIKGSLIILKVGDGGDPTETFTAISGARNARFSLGGTEIDTTTADDIQSGVTWATYIPGIADFSCTLSGVMKDVATLDQVISDKLAGTVRNYELLITGKGTISGPMRVTTFEGGGEYTDTATYDITIRAASALTWTAET